MSETIKDGHGTGNEVKVDDHGRMWVSANMIDHKQHHALYHKNLYMVTFNTTLQDTSETPISFFKNTDGTKDFEIYSAEVSSNSNVKLNWYFDDEYLSGGAAVTPLNSNRGSGNTIPSTTAIAYEGSSSGNLALTTTDRKLFHRTWLAANSVHIEPFDGALVFANATSASMTATGAANDEISVTVYMAYHDAGTVL